MKEVFEGTLWEAEVVKAHLQSEQIGCMLRDETLGAVTSPYMNSGGCVKVLVDEGDYASAMQIVSERSILKG